MTAQLWEKSKRSLLTCVSLTSSFTFSLLTLCLFTSFFSLCLPLSIFCWYLCHRHSSHSPVVVDVNGCHCIAKVGPHLEQITNNIQLAYNHTMVQRSLSFLSFSVSMSLLFLPLPPPEAFLLSSSISQSHNTPGALFFPLFMELRVRASVNSSRGMESGIWTPLKLTPRQIQWGLGFSGLLSYHVW